jgi:hypothetical protein
MKASRSFSHIPQILFLLIWTFFPSDGVWAQSGAVRPRTSPPSAPSLPQSRVGQSTLVGRVIYQDNEEPLKGARVRIFKASEESPLIAFANNRGEFRIEKLAAGKYYVTVEGPGIAAPSGMGMRLPVPMTAIPRREDFPEIIPKHDAEVTVDGTNAATLEVRVKRGGTVTGKVFRPNGSPAENVMVNLVSRDHSGGGPIMSQFTAHTDKDGVFRFVNVPAADYLVSAAVDNNRANLDIRARMRGEGRIVTYHPAATSVNDAATIRVTSGQEISAVNINLVSRNAYQVAGTVLRQRDGSPIAGATVLLRNKNAEASGPLMPGLAQRTTHSDAQGNWSFAAVTEGDYVVTALAPINRPRQPDTGVPDRERAFRESRQRFLVKQQDILVSGVDLQGLALSISGPGSIRGTVETDDGSALPSDLVIFLELVTENNRPGPPLPVRLGAGGSFKFSDIQAGEVFLSAAFPSGSKYIVESVTAGESNLKRTPLQVVEGAEAGPIRIRISTGLAVVEGRVLSKTGEGLADWVVLIIPANASEQRFRTSMLSVRTAADGSFRVSGAPGEYLIIARNPNGLPGLLTPEFFRNGMPDAERITLKPGEQTFNPRVAGP